MSGKGQTGQSMPTASLTSSLLARRGDARPAMRRPTIHQLNVRLPAQDDLGWNDMGHDARGDDQGAAGGRESDALSAEAEAELPNPNASPVQTQLEALARRVSASQASAPAPKARARKSQPAPVAGLADAATAKSAPVAPQPAKARSAKRPTLDSGVAAAVSRVTTDAPHKRARKAAFTLRLDPQRHLRLRLLSAVSSRSAQQLVVDALDAMIAADPNIENLVDQVEAAPQTPSTKSKRGV